MFSVVADDGDGIDGGDEDDDVIKLKWQYIGVELQRFLRNNERWNGYIF